MNLKLSRQAEGERVPMSLKTIPRTKSEQQNSSSWEYKRVKCSSRGETMRIHEQISYFKGWLRPDVCRL